MSYDDQIKIIEFREAVRKRPGMWIGGTDKRALHHMIYEVMDHMLDWAMEGKCTQIRVLLKDNHVVEIEDNTDGLPVDLYKPDMPSILELFMTRSYTGRGATSGSLYMVSGGLHCVGVACVNMLCEYMEVITRRDDYLWRQTYAEGVPTSKLEKVRELESDEGTGTKFLFRPDFTIFEPDKFDYQWLMKRCHEVAFLIPGLTVTLRDERRSSEKENVFHSPDGLKSAILEQNRQYTALHDVVHLKQEVTIKRDERADLVIGIEIAFQFTEGANSFAKGYANTVETRDGGTHLSALQAALLSCLNENIAFHDDEKSVFTWNEVRKGLSAIVSIRHPDPQFGSPTKVQLSNTEIFGPIAGIVYEAFSSDWQTVAKIVKHYLARRAEQNKS